MKNTNKIITHSSEQTMLLAEKLAGVLVPGDFVALKGDLGTGKTIFVKGLAKGLGVEEYEYVNSPSFVVVKEYQGKIPLYHFDVYRLNSKLFCETMDHEKYFYSQGISAVEWADKIQDVLPEECFKVSLEYGIGDERIIFFEASGEKPNGIMDEFIKRWK